VAETLHTESETRSAVGGGRHSGATAQEDPRP